MSLKFPLSISISNLNFLCFLFLDVIESPNTYLCQSVSEWVIVSDLGNVAIASTELVIINFHRSMTLTIGAHKRESCSSLWLMNKPQKKQMIILNVNVAYLRRI